MVEQATFLSLKLEFENMIMSMLIINPAWPCKGQRSTRARSLTLTFIGSSWTLRRQCRDRGFGSFGPLPLTNLVPGRSMASVVLSRLPFEASPPDTHRPNLDLNADSIGVITN